MSAHFAALKPPASAACWGLRVLRGITCRQLQVSRSSHMPRNMLWRFWIAASHSCSIFKHAEVFVLYAACVPLPTFLEIIQAPMVWNAVQLRARTEAAHPAIDCLFPLLSAAAAFERALLRAPGAADVAWSSSVSHQVNTRV